MDFTDQIKKAITEKQVITFTNNEDVVHIHSGHNNRWCFNLNGKVLFGGLAGGFIKKAVEKLKEGNFKSEEEWEF